MRRSEIDAKVEEIKNAGMDPQQRATAEEELESTRERRVDLTREIDVLRGRISMAQRWIGLDNESLRDAISCSLEMLGAEGLKPAATSDAQPSRFEFPNLEMRHGADPTWSSTLDTLRKPPNNGRRDFEWRRSAPIRQVVFSAPKNIDDDVVQLHLQHRVVQRLLGRFLSQGFVRYDLSRACLAQTSDAIPRVVLLGRLSLYGKAAVRLHEEILTVTARWSEFSARRGPLTPYARDAEARTLELLERALNPVSEDDVPEVVRRRLLAAIPQDIEQLLPHLEQRGVEAKRDAEASLTQRGKAEADNLRRTLDEQRKRVEKQLAGAAQLVLNFQADEERHQFERERRSWERWLIRYQDDIQREPARVQDFYTVTSHRLEPIGLAYLWPVTG
jgi:hypothetical protein